MKGKLFVVLVAMILSLQLSIVAVAETDDEDEVEKDGTTSEEGTDEEESDEKENDETEQDSEPESEEEAGEKDESSASEGEESDSESEGNESSKDEEEDESDAEEEDAGTSSPEEEGDQESEEPSESSDGEEQEQKDAEEQEEEVHIFSQDNAVEEVDIKSVNEDLERLGFIDWGGEIPSEFNSQSKEAIEAFQDYYELDESGEPDDETLNEIDQVLNTPYQSGDRGKPVVELKERLVELGFVNWSSPSQFYGNNTADVVRDFQEAYNLSVDGVMGSDSLSVLEEATEEAAPYHNGDEGEHVVEFKEKLVELGFVQWSSPSKYYGDNTAGVVRDFQDYYGLTVTGQANEGTRAKVDKVVNPPYQSGDRGEAVVALKEKLVDLGFVNWSSPSQFYGNNTADVVRDFQEAYNLSVDGVMGPDSLSVLEEVTEENAPYHIGDQGDHVVEFKEKLVELGFVQWTPPSEHYGDITAGVVRDFQDYYGLTITGQANEETRAKVDEVVNPPYKDGDRGEAVVSLKEKLVELGFVDWSSPSQFYGENTAGVVRDFQEAYNLSVDGIMGSDSLSVLEEVTEEDAPYHIGDQGNHVVEFKEKLVELGFVQWSSPSQFYGNNTADVVRDFQDYYGLTVTGQANEATRAKVDEVFSTPYQNGDRGEAVVALKEKLVELGFVDWSSPSQFYGDNTADVVRDFQQYYDFEVNGMVGDEELDKMEDVVTPPYQNGDRGQAVVDLKEKLVELGFVDWSSPSQFYGENTADTVRDFQEAYNLSVTGVMDQESLDMLEDGIQGITYSNYDYSLSDALDMQMSSADAPQTDNNYAYVSADYIENSEVTADTLNVRPHPDTIRDEIGQLENGTEVNILEELDGWYRIEYSSNQFKLATSEDTLFYLDPDNFVDDERQRFQFLDLSRTSIAQEEEDLLNDYLRDRGILEGKGSEFLEASRTHGVNDVYLLSHATLETGNGSSDLATGIEVGKNDGGVVEVVNEDNRSDLTDIETTYNMYGINAVDGDAYRQGAIRAYEEEWFTPEKAIIDGAQFIGNSYVKAGQNTLYKMRWNPDAMKDGYVSHQYATDIGWAYKQVSNMYNMYDDLGIDSLQLDIPEYK